MYWTWLYENHPHLIPLNVAATIAAGWLGWRLHQYLRYKR